MPPGGEHGEGERGAVLVIITLLLIVLIGAVVLVVDVGSLLYRRVALQNAADAAALASAISCASGQGQVAADVQAGQLAGDNSFGALIVSGYPAYSPTCDARAGSVTVIVTDEERLFFAPVLGTEETATVQAKATAIWGGAGAGENMAPLMLSAHRLSDCEIPPAPGTENDERECAFWWDNSPASSADPALTNAEWGTLDLLNWGVTPETHCNNSTPPQFEEWMFDGYYGALPIYRDRPTYVCRGQGNFGASLDNMLEDVRDLQLPLYFPVNEPREQIDANGDLCVPPQLMDDPTQYDGCSVDKYSIIGFARLQIIELYKKQDAEMEELCTSRVPGAEPKPNSRCLLVRWTGYTTDGLNPQGGENYGLVPVRLVE